MHATPLSSRGDVDEGPPSTSVSVLFYTIMGLYFCLSVPTTFLFYTRRHLQPIKARLPMLVVVSAVGNFFQFERMAMTFALEFVSDAACDTSRWINNLSYPLLILPYVFRAIFLQIVFRHNVEKLTLVNPNFCSSPDVRPQDLGTPSDRLAHQQRAVTSMTATESGHLLTRRKRLHEKYWLTVLFAFMVPLVIWSVVEQCLQPGFSPSNVGCVPREGKFLTGIEAFWLGLHSLEALAFSYFMYRLRNVRDEFSIKQELEVMCVLNVVVAIMLALSLGFQVLDRVSILLSFYLVPSLILFRAALLMMVSVVWPLYQSYGGGAKVLFPSHESVASLDALLKDPLALKYFQRFMVQEFEIDVLLFWMEVEIFRDESKTNRNPSEMSQYAKELYAHYLAPAAPFEAKIVSDELRQQIGDRVYHYVHPSIFDAAQTCAYTYLREHSFPLFLRSGVALEFLEYLEQEETTRTRLLASALLSPDDCYLAAGSADRTSLRIG